VSPEEQQMRIAFEDVAKSYGWPLEMGEVAYLSSETDKLWQGFRWGVYSAATLRQAARGPQFASADELAHWLESLHECDSNGSVGSRKWEAAQVAARAVRGMGSQAARVDEDVRDRVAKAIADVIGHGMREKCYAHADAALEAALSAQPAERQGEAVACIDARHLQLLRKDWRQGNCLKHPDDAKSGDVKLYLHPAAPVGVPDGWKLVPVEPTEEMLEAAATHDTSPRDAKTDQWNRDTWSFMVEAAPSAPQADRRTNYVSGSVDGSGKFQPTQQDPSAPQGVECKCSLRQRLVGDGCQVCNPKLAAELAADSTHPTERK
jgi:hypothetical protein